jgi:hypothetical protein
VIIGNVLFFLAGVAFGYAATGGYKFAPLVFPVVLALGAFVRDGVSGEVLLKLLVALVLTGIGIFLGLRLDERSRESEAAEAS